MKRSAIRFGLVVLGLLVLAGALRMTDNETAVGILLSAFIFAGVPLLVLAWVDLGRSLRQLQNPSRSVYFLGLVLSIPQILFAVLAILIGICLLGWVLYNSFITRLPEYNGGFLTFGIGPALIAFGVMWLRQALSVRLRDAAPSRSNNRWRGP
jgi:hypothetical protein